MTDRKIIEIRNKLLTTYNRHLDELLSWSEVERHVFIDFGDENLFWVKEGMGTNYGKGKQITKEDFIKKYGGNLELLPTLIENLNPRA